MATMTWDEFKKEVDRQLDARGLDGSVTIVYIIVNNPDMSDRGKSVDVYKNKDGSIWIEQ